MVVTVVWCLVTVVAMAVTVVVMVAVDCGYNKHYNTTLHQAQQPNIEGAWFVFVGVCTFVCLRL